MLIVLLQDHKVYVQHKIAEQSQLLWNLIERHKACIYVSGYVDTVSSYSLLSSYNARLVFCTILLRHLLLSWTSPSAKPHLFTPWLMLSIHLILGLPFARLLLTSIFIVCFTLFPSSAECVHASAN